MNNQSLYAPIYDQAVMMHKCVYHDNQGSECANRYTFKAACKVEVGRQYLAQTRGWYHVVTCVAVNVSIPMGSEANYKWIVGDVTELCDSMDTLLTWEESLIQEIHRKRAENMRTQMIEHLGVHPNQLTTLLSYDDDERMTDAETSTD